MISCYKVWFNDTYGFLILSLSSLFIIITAKGYFIKSSVWTKPTFI